MLLGRKSGAAKSRDVAFRLLVCVAQRVDAASGGAGDAAGASSTGLGDVFSMLLAGLAGTTAHMVCQCCLTTCCLTTCCLTPCCLTTCCLPMCGRCYLIRDTPYPT